MAAEVGKRMSTGASGGGNGPIKTVTEHNIDHLGTIQMTPHSTRSYLLAQQSNSLPSTPYIGGRDMNGHFRTPSPVNAAVQLSPSSTRTARSESDTAMRPLGKTLLAGCKYETGIMNFKRRMPYSLGSDKLESSPTKVKKHLEPDEEKKLSSDMRELYDRLQPTEESQKKRVRFVNKLETLLNDRWPGNEIGVHVFGSSGNMLFSNDSDVDICITTRLDALQRTCLLAKALGEYGMEKIECRPHAKVPIVKMWDPELRLACDMNVNNTAALNNTKMMKAYVRMDHRVRSLAMIVKYWTRRRLLNDAALGGTLSSYTWLCMIINFLQGRHPRILPSLQKPPYFVGSVEGLNGFGEAHELTKDFSQTNRETLGDLLFAFFRRYAHEVDYERFIISVREGCLISKCDKRWHPSQNTRLCVEEPFNIDRNLGNTADDTSFRGVHLELRRAFGLISQGKLEECFEEYHFPPQEERNLQNQHLFSKPVPQPRPVLTRSQSQTGSTRTPRVAGDHKKVGHQSQKQKIGSSSRRASSAVPPHTMSVYPITFVDMQTPGSQLHETLAHQYQRLQRQEQQLRAKMQHQGTVPSQMYAMYPNANPLYMDPLAHISSEMHRRHSNAGRGSQQVPLQHFTPLANVPGIASFLPPGFLSNQSKSLQTVTNPPSPSFTHAQMGFRGSTRRSGATDPSQYIGARSHSQPPANNSGIPQQAVYMHPEAYMTTGWQGIVLGQRSLQEIQHDYLQAHQRRYTHNDSFGTNVADHQRFDSPIGGSEFDSASIQDERMSKDDSVSDRSYYKGTRSQTLPHITDVTHQYEQRLAEREMATNAGSNSRPRASSSVAPHGISFFANEAVNSPEQRYVQPVRSPDWQNSHASFSRRIRPEFDAPLTVDGNEASDYGTPTERFVELAQVCSAYSSDSVKPSGLSAAMSIQETSKPLAFDGHSEKASMPKPLPTSIQFGQFPARAPYRTGQQPKPDDVRGSSSSSGSGRGLYSHTLSGLGINMSNGSSSKDHGMINGGAKQSPTVAGLNLASTLKPGNILSPVREVRTPSPTTTRSGLLMHHQIKTSNTSSRSIGNVVKEIVSSPLAAGSTSYAKANDRARSVETIQRKSNKQDQSGASESTKTGTGSTSQTTAKSIQNAKSVETPGKSLQQQNGSAPALAQIPAQPQIQQGGWQQSGTGKKKRNKKAASVGSIILPVDAGERKGG